MLYDFIKLFYKDKRCVSRFEIHLAGSAILNVLLLSIYSFLNSSNFKVRANIRAEW